MKRLFRKYTIRFIFSVLLLLGLIIAIIAFQIMLPQNIEYIDHTHFETKDKFSFTMILNPEAYYFVLDTTGLLGSRGPGDTFTLTINFINLQNNSDRRPLYMDGEIGACTRADLRFDIPTGYNKIGLSFNSRQAMSGALFTTDQLTKLDNAERNCENRRTSFIISGIVTVYLIILIISKGYLRQQMKPHS